MANTYYDSELTAADIAAALETIHGLIDPTNNGKILFVEAGTIKAKSPTAGAPVLESLTANVNGVYTPPSGVDGYNQITVLVPNHFEPGDEGKVVMNGALAYQSPHAEITQNGTYDTTDNNSVTVNVSGGGGATLITKSITQNGTYNASSDNADGYSQVVVNVSGGSSVVAFAKVNYSVGATCTATNGATTLTAPDTSGTWIAEIPNTGTWAFTATNGSLTKTKSVLVNYADSDEVAVYNNVDTGYTEVEYIKVENQTGPYIDTGVLQTNTTFFEIDVKPNSLSSGFFYGAVTSPYTEIEATSTNFNIYLNGGNTSVVHSSARHVIKAYGSNLTVDGETKKNNVTWSTTNARITLFARSSGSGIISYAKNITIYNLKIWQNNVLVRDFYPCYRDSDNEPGLFDSISRVFYPNLGSGALVVGPEV